MEQNLVLPELQKVLAAAYAIAQREEHDLLTTEHLLLALLVDTDASAALNAVGTDVEELEKDLREFLRDNLAIKNGEWCGLQQTLSLERVFHRAFFQAHASVKRSAFSVELLMAIFAEWETQAAYLLGEQGITRLDIEDFTLNIFKASGRTQTINTKNLSDLFRTPLKNNE